MFRWRIVTLVAVLFAVAAPAVTSGQPPTSSPAHLATLKARHASGVNGTVSVTPHGAGSMVNIMFSRPPSAGPHALMLVSGADCSDVARRAATMIPLNAVNGHASRTVVAVPFSAFTSQHFIVAVRNATSNAQQTEACARL